MIQPYHSLRIPDRAPATVEHPRGSPNLVRRLACSLLLQVQQKVAETRIASFHTSSTAPENPSRTLLLCGVLLLRGALAPDTGATASATATNAPHLACLSAKVGQFEKVEFQISGLPHYPQPFDPAEVDLRLIIKSASNKTWSVPSFYMQDYERRRLPNGRDWCYPRGEPVWRTRFAPMEIGVHQAMAILTDRTGTKQSPPVTFECAASDRKGFVRISRQDPRFLEYSDGSPYFMIGQNLAFIGSQQHVSLAKAEDLFARLAANGANYLRIWTCCDDWALAIEARKSAWGRSWAWRPPFVPMPENESRKCVMLSGSNRVQEVNPSHPIAVRSNTRYVVSGRVRTDTGAGLRLEIHGARAEKPFTSEPPFSWNAFRHEFTTGPKDDWLGATRLHVEGAGAAWLSDLSLKEARGGPELLWEAAINPPARGFYNPLDCFLLDELVAAAEQNQIGLQLCLLTRDLYMDALQNPASPAYDRAIADAKNLLRYAVARWGYSTSVIAWEYWNEMNPNLPTDRFYAELGAHLERIDPYRHLRTTSAWGPSAKDCRHPQIDLADTHFYLRPADKARLSNEVDAVLDRTRWLREHAPRKPAHLGEFGLADDQWRITDEMRRSRELVEVHNALWASALSGASGTALFWWWERLDERNVYPLYQPVSRFIADVPWNSGTVQPLATQCSNETMRRIGLRAGERAWLWCFDPEASWARVVTQRQVPPECENLVLELPGFHQPSYQIVWSDTRTGKALRQDTVQPDHGILRIAVPAFRRDIACRIRP